MTDTTSDCPICLCPIPSSPWGVCSPCGHPYHRECWNELVHSAISKSQGSKKRQSCCAVCKAICTSFVPVFVDLGNQRGEDNGDKVSDDSELTEVEEVLKEQWQSILQELKSLLLQDDNVIDESKMIHDCETNSWHGSERTIPSEKEDESVVDMTEEDHDGEQQIAETLTTLHTIQQTRLESSSLGAQNSNHLVITMLDPQMDKLLKDKRTRIELLLQRLSEIHSTLLTLLPTSPNTSSSKYLQMLKTKIFTLQKSRITLESRIDSVETKHNDLQSKLSTVEKALFDRTLESERERRKCERIQNQYTHLLGQYSSFQNDSRLKMNSLQEFNQQLKEKCAQLQTQSEMRNMKEMEEIRQKYSKMSQDVHDAQQKSNRMERQFEQLIVEKKNREEFWKRRIEEERLQLERMWEKKLMRERESIGSKKKEMTKKLMLIQDKTHERLSDMDRNTSFKQEESNGEKENIGTNSTTGEDKRNYSHCWYVNSKALEVLDMDPSKKNTKKRTILQERSLQEQHFSEIKRNTSYDIDTVSLKHNPEMLKRRKYNDKEDKKVQNKQDIPLLMRTNTPVYKSYKNLHLTSIVNNDNTDANQSIWNSGNIKRSKLAPTSQLKRSLHDSGPNLGKVLSLVAKKRRPNNVPTPVFLKKTTTPQIFTFFKPLT